MTAAVAVSEEGDADVVEVCACGRVAAVAEIDEDGVVTVEVRCTCGGLTRKHEEGARP